MKKQAMHSSDLPAKDEAKNSLSKQYLPHGWQMELIIASGILLFLIRVPDWAMNAFMRYEASTEIGPEHLLILLAGMVVARALTAGFILNLILRSIWVAYLGIYAVYPKGIDYDQLAYSDFFKAKNQQRSSPGSRLNRLEKYCRLSFSLSIILVLLTCSTFGFLVVLYKILKYIAPFLYNSPVIGYFIMIFIVFLVLGGVDFIFFRLLKKKKHLSERYYPFYTIYNWATLSYFYRQEWLVLLSNVKRWKIHTLSALFFIIGSLVVINELNSAIGLKLPILVLESGDDRDYARLQVQNVIKASRYQDQLKADQYISKACINSQIIRDNYLELFIVYNKWMDDHLSHFIKPTGLHEDKKRYSFRKDFQANDSLFNEALNQFFNIRIDGISQDSLTWYYYNHPNQNQLGFKTFIDIQDVDRGMHELIPYISLVRSDTVYWQSYRAIIPFVKN